MQPDWEHPFDLAAPKPKLVEKTLRVYDLTFVQLERFRQYLASGDIAIWHGLYAEQQAEDERRDQQVREDLAAGRPVPDTAFNRRALRMEPVA